MKLPTVYYTVITGKRFFYVKYAIAPAYEIKTFSDGFTCPGAASQEFQIAVPGEHEYLTQGAFQRKVGELSSRYKQDLARLADWNIGRKISI